MKLSFEQIKAISTGAVRFEEDENGIKFYRFTREQEKLYEETDIEFYNRSQATAGVKLTCKSLFIKTKIVPRYCRRYFSFDVFVNGIVKGHLDNFPDDVSIDTYLNKRLTGDEFEKEFDLGGGTKTVHVYLPWAVQAVIEEISIDDNAFVEPIKTGQTLLAFGDSITQGMDAMRSSNRYVAKLANFLGADEVNKGISGECYFPPLAETKDDLEPDYITVAYGTNDWFKKGRDSLQVNSKAFYQALRKNYPNVPIYAITPIWRADCQEEREYGLFEDVEKDICEAVKGISNVTVIRGYNLVPKDTSYFADSRLHPNDKGFEKYFEKLSEKIKLFAEHILQ